MDIRHTDWKYGPIEGLRVTPLRKFSDARGWLAEFFRRDEMPPEIRPEMGYLSLTHPGVARGPHEHREQTDLFLFFSGRFKVYLWDARPDSPTFRHHVRFELGEQNPAVVVIPPGIVHAYKNDGATDAYILNCPNRLYAGEGRKGPVDEIRHEDRSDSPFVID